MFNLYLYQGINLAIFFLITINIKKNVCIWNLN